MKCYEAVASAIVAEGCEKVFGVMGDGNMSLWSAFSATGQLDIISARHEAAAIGMADGYFRASGRIGIATVTYGPGLTQVGTSLVAAVRNQSSIVLVMGEFGRGDKNNVQLFDQRSFVHACGGLYVSVSNAMNMPREIAEAFYMARVRRTPVVLGVPMDILEQKLDWGFEYIPTSPYVPKPISTPSLAEIDQLVEKFKQAQRPIIIAGAGAKASGAREEIIALANRTGALLATSLKAKGLFAGHEYDLGIAGSYASAPAEQLLAEADFVLGVGAELGYFTTEGGLLFAQAEVARIDLASLPQEMPFIPGLYVRADAKQAIEALNNALAVQDISSSGYRTEQTRTLMHSPAPALETVSDGIDPRLLARELSKAMPKDTVITIGIGHYWGFFMMYTAVSPAAEIFYSYQMGAIGQTLFVASGVATALPSRPHLVIDGDGSFLMNIQHLETIVRHNIPMVVLVWNDVGYGAEMHKLRAKGMDASLGSWAHSPDFVTVAKGFGGDGVVINKESQLGPALAKGFSSQGLFVIDARVSPSIMTDTYKRLHFGIENQAPLLRTV